MELPAPEGWVKKFIPKQGGTPRRNEVVFISPTGEEIKNMRQLDQFLRSHPGGPPSSSFDWGTGDTPRRSARISEKAKILPEVEKPKRASRSSEKLKSSPEVEKPKWVSSSNEKAETVPDIEKNKLDSSSGLLKGTKRNKNTKYSGDEAEGEADEGDDSKRGDKEDAKGSKKRKKRKKTTEDEALRALAESPKDVEMEEAKGTKLTKPTAAATIEEIHGLVDHDSTEKTKGNVEGVELPIESKGAIEHELADKAEKNGDEKTEQDVELLEERGKSFKESLNDTEVSPTAAADSEKVAIIEKNDATKDVDMVEAESSMLNNAKDEATSDGSHGLVKDKSTDKPYENIEVNAEQPIEIPGEIKHELADKAGENDDTEDTNGTVNNKSKKEATSEGVYGLVEPDLNDKIEKNALENVEQNVEVDKDLELSKEKETKNEPVQQVEDKLFVTEVSADSDKVALSHMDDQAPAAKKDKDVETSGNVEIKDKEVKTTQKDKFEHGKEIKENTNVAKAFQAASDSEKVVFIEQHVEVSAAKNGEASVCIKESATLSENGEKGEEKDNAALDDFLHDYDDENMRI